VNAAMQAYPWQTIKMLPVRPLRILPVNWHLY